MKMEEDEEEDEEEKRRRRGERGRDLFRSKTMLKSAYE